jgi:PKD repeat protein
MKKIYSTSASIILFLFAFGATSFAQCPGVCFNENITNGCAPVTVVFTITSTNINAYRY